MEYMFITNNVPIAIHVTKRGIGRIFIDLETIGKKEPETHLLLQVTLKAIQRNS